MRRILLYRTLPLGLSVAVAAIALFAFGADDDAEGDLAETFDAPRLAFTGLRGESRDLFVQHPDGTSIALTEDEFRDGDAAYSPDGHQIAFVSDRGGSLDLWVIDADGRDRRQLTTNPAADVGPSWAPDGRRIAFVSDREGDRTNVFTIDVDTLEVTQVTFQDRGLTFVDWAPDGESLAFSLVGPDDPGDPEVASLELVVAPAAGGEPLVLQAGSGRNWGAAWSPDGEWIAFSWSPRGVVATEAAWLQVIRRDGSELRRLEQGAWADFGPSWAPDGQRLAFTSTRGGFTQVFVWDLQTDAVTLMLDGVPAFDPSWAPS